MLELQAGLHAYSAFYVELGLQPLDLIPNWQALYPLLLSLLIETKILYQKIMFYYLCILNTWLNQTKYLPAQRVDFFHGKNIQNPSLELLRIGRSIPIISTSRWVKFQS